MITPLPASQHVPRGGLGAQERRRQVDVDHPPPILLGELLRRRDEPLSSIVDEDVEASELLDGRAHERRDLRAVAHVGGHRDRATAPRGDRARDRLRAARDCAS